MLLSGVLVDWSVWRVEVALLELLRLPDEVLQKIAVVLGQNKKFRFLDDVAKICNELVALRRELL